MTIQLQKPQFYPGPSKYCITQRRSIMYSMRKIVRSTTHISRLDPSEAGHRNRTRDITRYTKTIAEKRD
jgi:hypothetical protein